MTVLRRADRQAQTRGQLLATARVLFLRDGYFATSLERVADEAGYSKGAVYSNFSSKDELCLAVLDEIRREQAARLIVAISAGSTSEDRLVSCEAWAETAIGDEGGATSRSNSAASYVAIPVCASSTRPARMSSVPR